MDEVLVAMKAIDCRFRIQAAEWWAMPDRNRTRVLFRNKHLWHEAYVESGVVNLVGTQLSSYRVASTLDQGEWTHYTGE